ncbi:MAG: DinB family protein [Saprospiraceae bacterium]
MEWRRPNDDESAGYFNRYIEQVPGEDPIAVLKQSNLTSRDLMRSLSLNQWDHRYAEGKWSIKEVWVHILDTERIFAYRALRFGRGDETALPGFDQDTYILPSNGAHRTITSIVAEYEAVRKSTLTLFENFTGEALSRSGLASNNKVTVRAIAFIIAGHEIHHIKGFRDNYQVKI